jgi:Ser/Thr protein kinase RdoA (MazF antagonist)
VSAALATHVGERHGVEVTAVAPLDQGVLRCDLRDGRSWVARIFPGRALARVQGDAVVLAQLARGGFPAERLAAPDAVTMLDGSPVIVTELVAGEPAAGRARTFAFLGALLGRLHAHDGADLRPGGAWHHLADGQPVDEIAAALDLIDEAQPDFGSRELAQLYTLRDAIERLDPCEDLPHAFVHPDFVPVNAIATPDPDGDPDATRLAIVDWAGAGRGPRLWSLGLMLWAAGARDMRLVDAAVKRYARHVRLTPAELARLPGAILARGLTIECWSVCHRRARVADALEQLPRREQISAQIAARARAAFAAAADL